MPSSLVRALSEGSILAMYVRTYVRTCQSRSGRMSICSYLHSFMLRNSYVTCTDDGGRSSIVEDREEWHFLTMEDGEDSATGSLQRMYFAESSAECNRRLATLRKRKQ